MRGIGLSGQMHGATLLDHADRPLRPCILWNDGRSAEEAAELDADPRFREVTGNIVFPGFTAPKLVWVHRHEPKIFGDVAKVLLPKDYVRLWLTGDHASDMSDSAGTSWLDVAKRDWSDELLAATQLHRDQMPALFEGTEPTGKLRAVLASRWGMAEAPVVAGGARRQRRFRLRRRHRRARLRLRLARHVRRALRLQRQVPPECGERGARLLPRAARHLASDGRHPLRRRVARMARRRDRRERRRTAEAVAATPAERRSRSSSCPTSPASARRTTTPPRAAASSASRTQTDRAALARAVMEGVAFAFADCLDALKAAGHEGRARHRRRRRLALARLAADHRQRAEHADRRAGRRRFRRRLRRRAARADRRRERRSARHLPRRRRSASRLRPDAAAVEAYAARHSRAIARSIPPSRSPSHHEHRLFRRPAAHPL